MKIINYKYGWRNKFFCVIDGRIVMTKQEWKKVKKYLLHPSLVLYYSRDKTMLKSDMDRAYETKKGQLINIRVYATEKMISKFKTTGAKYKRNNYEILILN